jgi:DNA primase
MVPDSFLAANLVAQSSASQKAVLANPENPKHTLSERIKASVSVYDFVGQYVELSPNGRGLCPFHNDQHASFAVDIDQNYWHCFAGCGGGSVIDFWMKRQGCDFTTAIHDLADMLLKPIDKLKEL